ncbi:MAG: MBOAT family O-acyltransferase [Kiritimatiellia bacterium]|jgi:alginate O-acetyltransferase complex protein AlgI
MVFSSHIFMFYFLPAALLLYALMPRRGRHLLLTLVSYVFYGWSNPLFVPLLLFSTVVDYVCGLAIACDGFSLRGTPPRLLPGGPRSRLQRRMLILSIIVNLGLLGFFKYFNFGVDNLTAVAQWLGIPASATVLRITLPLGISFYTFQSMSYTIDVFRGHAQALRNFTDFACFVSMFPQLVAGPIIRFSELADQLRHHPITLEKFARGVVFFSLGLAKKILLANPCGKLADTAFAAAGLSAVDAWYGVTAYAFQIYFDFSGYSDMAIGLGLMLGFVFPKNFDSPYISESITEFWRRWHISLSSWLRDYLYIPLGGNRRGTSRTYLNLMLVMLLGGLWHGAAWNFVIWGAIHGVWLAIERSAGKVGLYRHLPKPGRIAITFLIVLIAWVFFRADDLPSAARYLACMFGGSDLPNALLVRGIMWQPYYLLVMIAAALTVWAAPQTWDWSRTMSWGKAVTATALLLLASAVLVCQAYNPFIYFIF